MKKYISDNSLIKTWIYSEKFEPYPLIAVFEFDNKRLVYIGTKHNDLKSFDAIDYAFTNFGVDCVVTEIEHSQTDIEDIAYRTTNELVYSASVALKKGIPVVFADTNLADWVQTFEQYSHKQAIILQTMWILNDAMKYKQAFGKPDTVVHAFKNVEYTLSELGYKMVLTMEEFHLCCREDFGFAVSDENISDILACFKNWSEPNLEGNITNKIWAQIGLCSRNPYMLGKIFEAVNQYDTVLVTMGAGHYEEQRLVLEKAFGVPKYI